MTILHITGGFPIKSESFVIRQMLGVRDAGIEVKPLAMERGSDPVETMGQEAYRVAEVIQYAPKAPPGRWSRVGWALRLVAARPEFLISWIKLLAAGLKDSSHRYSTYLALAAGVLGQRPFDLIHVQFGHLGRMVALLKKFGFIDCPVVVVFHGGDSTMVLKDRPGYYRDVYPFMDRLLTVSGALKNIHVREGCPEEKIEVFILGINEDVWPYQPHFNREPMHLLGIGRLVEKKGFGVVIRALGQLKDRGIVVRFRIAGDGPVLENLKALAAEANVAGQVEFLGWVTHGQLPAIMQASDVLVVPSVRGKDGDEEGLPTVIKEAMASGTLVIGSCHSGIPELVQHEETGFLIDEGDVDGWVERLNALHHQGVDHAILDRARELVCARCGQAASTKALLGIYEESLETGRVKAET